MHSVIKLRNDINKNNGNTASAKFTLCAPDMCDLYYKFFSIICYCSLPLVPAPDLGGGLCCTTRVPPNNSLSLLSQSTSNI